MGKQRRDWAYYENHIREFLAPVAENISVPYVPHKTKFRFTLEVPSDGIVFDSWDMIGGIDDDLFIAMTKRLIVARQSKEFKSPGFTVYPGNTVDGASGWRVVLGDVVSEAEFDINEFVSYGAESKSEVA